MITTMDTDMFRDFSGFAGSEIAPSWSLMRPKIQFWRPEFHITGRQPATCKVGCHCKLSRSDKMIKN